MVKYFVFCFGASLLVGSCGGAAEEADTGDNVDVSDTTDQTAEVVVCLRWASQ